MRLSSLLVLLLATIGAAAQTTATAIFNPAFKSLQVGEPGNRLGFPLIWQSNEGSRLTVGFDELAEDSRYLRYRLVHCDSDWNRSPISELEYADGFNEGEIDNYALSEGTFVHYVHYELTVPDEQLRPLLSGNYLVEVYDQDDPSTTLLQARFMVCEDLGKLSADVTSRTDADYNGRHQQLAVHADLKGARIENLFNDLRLVIIQNGREADRHVLEKPLRASIETADYEHQKELIFPAGNEYRRFSTANARYPGMGVEHIDYMDGLYQAMLREDYPRPDSRYIYDQDQAGRFVVDEINATDPSIQADYVQTFFTLKSPKLNGDVYIDGDLVQRSRSDEARMIYDDTLGAYIKTLLLKQGLYNYQYVTADGSTAQIEGDHYETGNEYLILLYYCPPSARYQRLIAATTLFSGR